MGHLPEINALIYMLPRKRPTIDSLPLVSPQPLAVAGVPSKLLPTSDLLGRGTVLMKAGNIGLLDVCLAL